MSNAISFINTYTQNIVQLCQLMQTLRVNNDQIDADPTLIDRYFSTPPFGQAGSPNQVPRTDIVAQDVTNAHSALVQMLFTFDSGSPTQKSYLYKMLP
jgi:hypothetical protein